MRNVVLVLVALAVVSTGCRKMREKAEEAAVEKATGQKLTVDDKTGGGITLTGPDGGSLTVSATQIPSDFPKSIPIYPGAKIKTAMRTSSAGKNSFIVGLETNDPPDQVASFYKAQLKSWKSKADLNTGQGHMETFEDTGEKIGLTVTATKGADGTDIGLLTAPL